MKYLLIIFSFIALSCDNSETKAVTKEKPGVVEGYKPSQPIAFSHSLHSEMDCKYCHNSVDDSKNVDLPSVNVCINCHKTNIDTVDNPVYLKIENDTICSHLKHPNTPIDELSQDCSKCHY